MVVETEHPVDRLRRMIFEGQRDACAGNTEACEYWLGTYVETLRLPEPQVVIVEPPRASAEAAPAPNPLLGLPQDEWEAGMRELLATHQAAPADGVQTEERTDGEVTGDGTGEAVPPIPPQPLDQEPPQARRGKRS
jgi:hypothetical protein